MLKLYDKVKLYDEVYVCLNSYATTPIDFNFRNTDKKRRERVALNRAMGKRPEPRKQIKVVSTSKEWLIHGYIDVRDGCWRRNVLVTILRC